MSIGIVGRGSEGRWIWGSAKANQQIQIYISPPRNLRKKSPLCMEILTLRMKMTMALGLRTFCHHFLFNHQSLPLLLIILSSSLLKMTLLFRSWSLPLFQFLHQSPLNLWLQAMMRLLYTYLAPALPPCLWRKKSFPQPPVMWLSLSLRGPPRKGDGPWVQELLKTLSPQGQE